jgi:hypothetical protein
MNSTPWRCIVPKLKQSLLSTLALLSKINIKQ